MEVKGDWAGSVNPKIVTSQNVISEGEVVGRYYDVWPDGYIVVPVLRELSPVKMYSETSKLNLDEEAGPADFISDIIGMRTRTFSELYGSLDNSEPNNDEAVFRGNKKANWDQMDVDEKVFQENLAVLAQDTFEEGEPLLTSHWHQNAPFNNYCPMGDGGRCVVGCVATAYAQVMNYHQWPPNGSNMSYYTWGGDRSCGG